MEPTQLRFIVSQKRGNIKAVALFMLVFTIVMLVMVDYLAKRELEESAELTVITVVVFGQFIAFLPALLRMSRGEASIALGGGFLVVKLDRPKMLMSFTEMNVPFEMIKSYDMATEGNPGLVIRLEQAKQSFNLHVIDKDQELFDRQVNKIIKAFEQYNESKNEGEVVAFKSVYTSSGMRVVAVIYLLTILIFGAVLFTQPHVEISYQAIFFSAIGLPFLWEVGRRLRKK